MHHPFEQAPTATPFYFQMANGLVQALEKRATAVRAERAQVSFCPKDTQHVRGFLSKDAAKAKVRARSACLCLLLTYSLPSPI